MDGLAISGRLGAQASEWIPNGNVQLVDARSSLDCETAPSGKTLLTASRTNFTLGLRFFGIGVQIFGAFPTSSGSGGVSFIMDGVASSQVVYTGSTSTGCESQLLAQMRTPEQGHHVVTITPQAATVPVEVAFYSAFVWNPPLPTSTSGDTVAATRTSPASDTPSTSSTSAQADGAPPDPFPSNSRTASSPSSVSSGSIPSPSSTETNGSSSGDAAVTVLSATSGPGTATSTVTLANTASSVSDHTSGTVPAGLIVAAVLIPLLLLLLLWLAFILRKRRRRKAVLVTPLQVGAEATSDNNNIAGSAPSRSTEKGRMNVTPTRDESAGADESKLGTGRDASTMDADSDGAALVRAARRAGFTTETLLQSLNRVHKGGNDADADWEPPMYH
ncbi:hypothetical protein EXIGLDRAFT_832500 [Exidia glandulosa HHB12029]|uniref:Uncharacterized protein n=1 Tax=Exidia glandulosa HHB12029 TaxID=1314781 RepID=A0A166B5J7_EXIGL|nr:hypothetical protein EXIGLDRAFT_832500 [Exidia glandulosa HHB12029]